MLANPTLESRIPLPKNDLSVSCGTSLPSLQCVVLGTLSGRVWALRESGGVLWTWSPARSSTDEVCSLCERALLGSEHHPCVVAGFLSGSMRLIQARDGTVIWHWSAHRSRVCTVSVLSECRFVSSAADGCCVWDSHNQKAVRRRVNLGEQSAVSQRCQIIASFNRELVIFWEPSSDKAHSLRLKSDVCALRWNDNPDRCSTLAIFTDDRRLTIYEAKSRSVLYVSDTAETASKVGLVRWMGPLLIAVFADKMNVWSLGKSGSLCRIARLKGGWKSRMSWMRVSEGGLSLCEISEGSLLCWTLDLAMQHGDDSKQDSQGYSTDEDFSSDIREWTAQEQRAVSVRVWSEHGPMMEHLSSVFRESRVIKRLCCQKQSPSLLSDKLVKLGDDGLLCAIVHRLTLNLRSQPSNFPLSIAVSLLRSLRLTSRHRRLMIELCELIVECKGEWIRNQLQSGYCSIGVDIAAEDRREQAQQCWEELSACAETCLKDGQTEENEQLLTRVQRLNHP